MFPAILHTIALIIGLCVQSMASPLASAWLFFHLSGCAVLLYKGRYKEEKSILWYMTVAWLTALGASAFLFASVPGAASIMFVLSSMPSLALCMRREYLKVYASMFGAAISLYAGGLIFQSFIHMTYTSYNLGDRYAWPLLDPNNAAALINIALIPSVYFAINRDIRLLPISLFLAAALKTTGSEAGFLEAIFGGCVFLWIRFGAKALLINLIAGILVLCAVFYHRPDIIVEAAARMETRFPIWDASWRLLWIRPLGGIGLGCFGIYYHQIRTEFYTGGWFAHNDILQLAIEMGIPCAAVFCAMMAAVIATTRRTNIVTGVTMVCILMGSMVEFQFYVPCVSIALGTVLGAHILNYPLTSKSRRMIMLQGF